MSSNTSFLTRRLTHLNDEKTATTSQMMSRFFKWKLLSKTRVVFVLSSLLAFVILLLTTSNQGLLSSHTANHIQDNGQVRADDDLSALLRQTPIIQHHLPRMSFMSSYRELLLVISIHKKLISILYRSHSQSERSSRVIFSQRWHPSIFFR